MAKYIYNILYLIFDVLDEKLLAFVTIIKRRPQSSYALFAKGEIRTLVFLLGRHLQVKVCTVTLHAQNRMKQKVY